MKIGVKTFDSEEFLNEFKNSADFFEIMAIESVNYSFLKKFHVPIVIHAQHQSFGVNHADKTKHEKNLASVNYAKKIADLCNAKKIILHTGEKDNKECTIESLAEFLKEIKDERIIIENCFKRSLFSLPEEWKSLKKYVNGFCFDINHAIYRALEDGADQYYYLKDFIKLKPKHFHLGGQDIKRRIEHTSFKDSNIDLKKIVSLLPKDAEITLETSQDATSVKEDLRTIRELI